MRTLLFLTLLFSLSVKAETSKADSLMQVWKTGSLDTVRLDALLKIISIKMRSSLDSTAMLSLEGATLSRQLKRKDYEGKFYFYNEIALRRSTKFKEAIQSGKLSASASTTAKQWAWAAGVHREIADCYIALTQFDSALWHLFKGLEIDKNDKENFGTANLCNTVSYVYELTNQPSLAISWSKKCLDIAQRNNYQSLVATSYFDLGNIYDLIKKFDSSLYFKKKALVMTEPDDIDHLLLLGNITNTFIELKNADSALYYANKFQLAAQKDDAYYGRSIERSRAVAQIHLGKIYLMNGNATQAETYLLKGLAMCKAINYFDEIRDAYINLSKVYVVQNQATKALHYHELYDALTDSVYTKEKEKAIQELTTRYETEKKDNQIKVLTLEAEAKQQWIISIIAIGVAVIILLTLILVRRNLKLKADMSLALKNAQQERFRSVVESEEKERKRIARELHDGIGQLLSTTRLLLSDIEESKPDARATKAIEALDSSIQEVRTISHNMMPAKLTEQGLTATLREMATTVGSTGKLAVGFVSSWTAEPDEYLAIPIYRSVQEIVNNMLKYAKADRLEIALKESGDSLEVMVSDNGIGFNTDLINQSKGLGWANILSRIELVGGHVEVVSKQGMGTKVMLRVSKHRLAQSA